MQYISQLPIYLRPSQPNCLFQLLYLLFIYSKSEKYILISNVFLCFSVCICVYVNMYVNLSISLMYPTYNLLFMLYLLGSRKRCHWNYSPSSSKSHRNIFRGWDAETVETLILLNSWPFTHSFSFPSF